MARIFEALRRQCRAIARRLLDCDCDCDCHAPAPAVDLAAVQRAYDRIVAEARPLNEALRVPSPLWAPLAEPADAAIDALWKVPRELRGRRWYDAVYYCREVKAMAAAASAAQAAPGQGAP